VTGGVSFGRRIRSLAEERPDGPAVRHVGRDGSERALAWPELDRRSGALAGALAARGVGLGDRVSLGMRNSPQFTLSALAAWRLGAVPVPVRWDLPEWERARVRAVIAPRVDLGPDDTLWIDAASDGDVPDLPDAVSPQVHGICSSGSTGTPKVILSERPALYDTTLGTPFMEAWRPVARPQTVLVPAPMYHTNGFSTLLSLLAGDRLVVLERFDAARAVDAVERHGITTFTATPTMLQRIADLPGIDGRDLSGVDWILQGAAPMPPSLVHRWAGLIGADRIVMVYGMTEGLGFTALRGDEWMEHQGSVGRGVRDTELRILDPGGRDLPAGAIGEIYLRSPLSAGFRYLGDAAPRGATDDGFATVGDLGYLDGDGYLHLVDRRVDMIVSGGANVYPAEVETALVDHPAIADIVVVGLRDADWGRRVHAIVEPADPAAPPSDADVIAYAKSRLAPYKVPKTVEIVDAIPRSEATKINRRALVEARGG
jgi:bile acid-coenzyme A ligase